jgi:hypothetical protein
MIWWFDLPLPAELKDLRSPDVTCFPGLRWPSAPDPGLGLDDRQGLEDISTRGAPVTRKK